MNGTAQKVITQAIYRGSLAALHTDLQMRFYTEGKKSVYENVKKISEEFRGVNIPNMWGVYVDDFEHKTSPLVGKHFDPGQIKQAFHIARADDSELVFTKISSNLFSHKLHYDPLDYFPESTIIKTGVDGKDCVKESVIGMFRNAKNAGKSIQVILAADAINIHTQTPQEYIDEIKEDLKFLGIKIADNALDYAYTNEILDVVKTHSRQLSDKQFHDLTPV